MLARLLSLCLKRFNFSSGLFANAQAFRFENRSPNAAMAFDYGYEEALHERMHFFATGEVIRVYNEEEDSVAECFQFPGPVQRHLVSNITLDDEGVHGHSLSGELLFHIARGEIPCEFSQLTAGILLGLLAGHLELGAQSVLLEAGQELSASDRVSGTLTLKQTLRDCRPLICRKVGDGENLRLGEGDVSLDMRQLPNSATIQAIKEWRTWVTRPFHGLPGGEEDWLIYTRLEVMSYRAGPDEALEPIGYFPEAPCWKLPAGSRQWGGERSDVWSAHVSLPLTQPLDQHAAATLDRPLPRYQMIVDPNQFVDQTEDGPVWVPCEFDITADGAASLVGGMRSHQHPHLAQQVALPVLSAALPLLSKLRRPQLLLDDRRLQVVFKAQRIVVPGVSSDNSDSEYVGLWHVDGHREHVAAVVLYYYHVDPALHGGDMEFCGREPMDVIGAGDCSNNFQDLSKQTLLTALRGDGPAVHNCRVPIGEGTLLVFSNYQMAHRVLRLVNSSTSEASRDFVALFILDPSVPALRPARSILAKPFLLQRTLARAHLAPTDILRVMEFVGASQSDEARRKQRNQMLMEQLKPTGQFALGSNVYATGNGCYAMIGWLHNLLNHEENDAFEDLAAHDGWKGRTPLVALNLPPLKVDRGLSEVLSVPTAELERRLQEEEDSQTSSGSLASALSDSQEPAASHVVQRRSCVIS